MNEGRAGSSEFGSHLRTAQERTARIGEGFEVAGGIKPCMTLVLQDRADLAYVRRDRCDAAAEVFEEFQRRKVEGMVQGWIGGQGDVHLPNERRDLVMGARAEVNQTVQKLPFAKTIDHAVSQRPVSNQKHLQGG